MRGFTSGLAEELAGDVLERFVRYARIDTQAVRDRDGCPSSPGQLVLGALLVEELLAIGLGDARIDENGYVTATLPAVGAGGGPAIGLLAHVDVSPDAPAVGVRPIVHRGYDGGPIRLPREGTVLDPAAMPELRGKEGEDLVTSSGDTLLGADDKAGVAEIMAAVAYLAGHPELRRPRLRIGFLPDEEIGLGPKLFDVEAFGAGCAYTLDGSTIGELQDESFSAVAARIGIEGVDVHPGQALGKMINAGRLAARVVAGLPSARLTPETTSGREGFIHVYPIEATAGRAEIMAIVRDYDDDLLAGHVALLREVAERVVAEAPGASLAIEVTPQYPNMHRYIERAPEVVAAAEAAIVAEGIEVLRQPIRGGTDGSRLSAMGLPTPNIFAGGHELHLCREWVSVRDMAAAAAVVVRLAGVWAGGGAGATGSTDGASGSGVGG
ncbi:MAG: peptidase T [Actinobacteria bacterium]|nr:peptidase T [Actinomycetota bacterium]